MNFKFLVDSKNWLFVLSYDDLYAEKLYFHCVKDSINLGETKRSDTENTSFTMGKVK